MGAEVNKEELQQLAANHLWYAANTYRHIEFDANNVAKAMKELNKAIAKGQK